MFQIQLRYFQYILSLAIFVGILISSTPLISSCFVGLTLVWLTEMLSGQFDINSDKYYVILILLLLSFSSVSFKNLFSSIEPYESFIIFLVVLMIYFLFQSDVNIFKIGNSIFITVITFLVNRDEKMVSVPIKVEKRSIMIREEESQIAEVDGAVPGDDTLKSE